MYEGRGKWEISIVSGESGLASPEGYVSNSNIDFVCYVENRAFRWKVRASISLYSVGPVNVKLA